MSSPVGAANEENGPEPIENTAATSASLSEAQNSPVSFTDLPVAYTEEMLDVDSFETGGSGLALGCEVSCQTEITAVEMQSAVQSVERLLAENRTLSKSVPVTRPFSEEFFSEDADVRFYTGLYSLDMLKCVFDHVSSGMAKSVRTKLPPFQEMVVALVKLRLDTPLYDLACRMGVDSSTISRILLKWFTAMHIRLKHLIRWPERDVLQKTMPVCFRESFGTRVVVIIDCFEVFIDRPSNLMARAQTWSNYKHHNTITLLLGTTAQGVVSFI